MAELEIIIINVNSIADAHTQTRRKDKLKYAAIHYNPLPPLLLHLQFKIVPANDVAN